MIRVNKIEKSDARIAAFKRYKVLCISTVKSLLDVEYIIAGFISLFQNSLDLTFKNNKITKRGENVSAFLEISIQSSDVKCNYWHAITVLLCSQVNWATQKDSQKLWRVFMCLLMLLHESSIGWSPTLVTRLRQILQQRDQSAHSDMKLTCSNAIKLMEKSACLKGA